MQPRQAFMRILFLNVSGELGGAERVLLGLFQGLRRQAPDMELRLLAPTEGPFTEQARALGLAVEILPFPSALARTGDFNLGGRKSAALTAQLKIFSLVPASLLYAWRLRRRMAEHRSDVIHASGFKMHILGALARPRARLLWHFHDYAGSRPLVSRLLRVLRRRCDLAVANSASVSQDLRAIFSSRPPVQVIHNGLDIARFQPQGPTAGLDAAAGLPPLAPAVPRLGLVATLACWKGHAVFMQALAQIQDLPWRAYIIGAPVYQTLGSQYSIAELRQRAEALKLTDRIGFTGACADMPAVYRALDIVIHASTQPEPFGMTILEAMACARPVIVSYAGGAAELIQPGVDALAFPPGQSQALAERLRCLLGDSELRRRLGREARNSGERRFALDRMTEHFIQAYAQLAPPRARAAGA